MNDPEKTSRPMARKNTGFYVNARKRAMEYRTQVLQLDSCGEYPHRLSKQDAADGWNFLPSLRRQILSAVQQRADMGKGVEWDRTTENMLASQPMCFNLFVPLNLDKPLASRLLSSLLGESITLAQDIQIEYTPPNSIFGDQAGTSGVDCDALLRYRNAKGEPALLVVETKYVEEKFSRCGFRNPAHPNPCPTDVRLNDDFSACRYQSLKHYQYWEVAKESGQFRMDLVENQPCPFGDLWQLWVNMALAYGIAKLEGVQDYRYAVVCPKQNTKLSGDGRVFQQFQSCLVHPDQFKVIYLEDIAQELNAIAPDFSNPPWIGEFIQRYVGCGMPELSDKPME